MSKELQISINMLQKILDSGDNTTIEAFNDIYEISNGNKKIILQHLKAVYNIFGVAIKELENAGDDE